MPNVVTTGSAVTCGHEPGRVALTSSAKLRVKVGEQPEPVVLKVDGATVQGCNTPSKPDAGNVPCATAQATGGLSTKLRVGEDPVLLDTLTGTTSGTVGNRPQEALGYVSGQSKLRAP